MSNAEFTAMAIRRRSPQRQTRLVFFLGFGGLLLLMGIFGASAMSFLSQISVREERIRQDYVTRDRVLQSLRSEIYTSGTHIRDFLLDTNDALAIEHREQFLDTQHKIEEGTAEYRSLLRDSGSRRSLARTWPPSRRY